MTKVFSKRMMTATAALAFTLPAFALAQAQGGASQPGANPMPDRATSGAATTTPDVRTPDAQNPATSASGARPDASATENMMTNGQNSAAGVAGAPAPGSQITSGQGTATPMPSDTAGMKTYPPCSRTVTDSCMQRGGMDRARSRRHHG